MTVQGNSTKAGINVPTGASLAIYAQSAGTVMACVRSSFSSV